MSEMYQKIKNVAETASKYVGAGVLALATTGCSAVSQHALLNSEELTLVPSKTIERGYGLVRGDGESSSQDRITTFTMRNTDGGVELNIAKGYDLEKGETPKGEHISVVKKDPENNNSLFGHIKEVTGNNVNLYVPFINNKPDINALKKVFERELEEKLRERYDGEPKRDLLGNFIEPEITNRDHNGLKIRLDEVLQNLDDYTVYTNDNADLSSDILAIVKDNYTVYTNDNGGYFFDKKGEWKYTPKGYDGNGKISEWREITPDELNGFNNPIKQEPGKPYMGSYIINFNGKVDAMTYGPYTCEIQDANFEERTAEVMMNYVSSLKDGDGSVGGKNGNGGNPTDPSTSGKQGRGNAKGGTSGDK